MKENKSRGIIFFIILGIFSVAWFLIRVIPKPSRITYPCQRMAAANATGFITWLFGTAIASIFFKKAFRKLRESKIPVAVMLIVFAVGVGASMVMLTSNKKISAAIMRADNEPFTPPEGANQPLGTAQGIIPGRVTWAYDPGAVNYDPNSVNVNGNWWEDRNTAPERIDRMFSLSLDAITGATTAYDGWDKLFRDANMRKGAEDFGYAPGEKIAIKANLVMGLSGNKERANFPGPSPQLLLAIVKDLIEEVGVPGECITVYDVSARIPDYIMDPFKNHENAEYQKIRFVGNPKYLEGEEANRYFAAQGDLEAPIHFADTSVADIFWPKSVSQSDYLIHLPNLKPHHMAGVTLTAKNLYGSVFIPTATTEFWPDADGNYLHGFGPNNKTDSLGNPDPHSGLHRCAAVHDYEDANVGFFPGREYGTYNYLVDILGHPEIRTKSILYIMDAIYACRTAGRIAKYESFGNEYTASLFMSQDVIALESVSIDFLRSDPEPAKQVYGCVDNYLHESALADQPPSGLVYNPGAEDSPLISLGVHEHWNNATDKQYSRNLGTGDGIELYRVELSTGIESEVPSMSVTAILQQIYPNPFQEFTTIPFELSRRSRVEISIFDQSGRMMENLASGEYPAGSFSVQWDARNFPAGIYYCRMTTGHGFKQTTKLQKLK